MFQEGHEVSCSFETLHSTTATVMVLRVSEFTTLIYATKNMRALCISQTKRLKPSYNGLTQGFSSAHLQACFHSTRESSVCFGANEEQAVMPSAGRVANRRSVARIRGAHLKVKSGRGLNRIDPAESQQANTCQQKTPSIIDKW